VIAIPAGRLLVDCDLVGSARIRPPALRGGEDVLVEVPPADAAQCFELLGQVGLAVDEGSDVERRVGAGLCDLGEARDPVHQRIRVRDLHATDVDRHRRRVDRTKEPGVGRLRAARTGEGEQRETADQAEQQSNRGEAAPATA
jgi:hypothetical protein